MISNNIIINLIAILISLFLLIKASDWVLDGAILIAKKLKLSPLIIGSTIVAIGTVLPSIAINLVILFTNKENIDIAVGNMLGTTYVNLGLALGIPAFLTDIVTKYNVFEKEIPLYLGIFSLLAVFVIGNIIIPIEGFILFLAYLMILIIIYQYAKREKKNLIDSQHEQEMLSEVEDKDLNSGNTKKIFILLIFGIVILIVSAFILTYFAPLFADNLGISQYIIGLTLVGVGTSLPTIVAGIKAAKKGYIDIILGNVFGGNIVNIGIGIGLPAMFGSLIFSSESIEDMNFISIYNMIILFCVLIEMRLLGGNKTISRLSGIIIVTIYLLYIVYKILKVVL